MLITSVRAADPRLEHYRNLSDRDLLQRLGLFAAEGRLVVGRVIEAGLPVVSLLVNAAGAKAMESAIARLPNDTPVYVCEARAFAAITGFNLHRGCLALVKRPAARGVDEVALAASLLLVLEGVTDADNVGSAFRNAAAFGAGGVVLSPACCDPLYRKAIRTSMGAVFAVPHARSERWPDDLARLKTLGFRLIALTPREGAINLQMSERGPRTALLVGSEGPGLSEAAEALADVRVRIPMRRDVDSLNLATAAAIALYHLAP